MVSVPTFTINLDKSLQEKIEVYNRKVDEHEKIHLSDGEISLQGFDALIDHLETLRKLDKLKKQQISLIEACKLALLTQYRAYLQTQYQLPELKTEDPPESKKKYFTRIAAFAFIFLSAMALDAVGNFLYGQSLLLLIPGITNPVVMGFAIGCCLLNIILFCSFEAVMLKNGFGVTFFSDKNQYELQEKQIDEINKINRILRKDIENDDKMTVATYKMHATLMDKTNQNILNLKENFKDFLETLPKKLFRWFMTFFGGVMAVGAGYFMGTTLLTAIAATMMGTPVGWILMGIAMISSLALYLSMRGTGMLGMLNPTLEQFKKVQKKLNKFSNKPLPKYEKIIEYKKDHELLKRTSETMRKMHWKSSSCRSIPINRRTQEKNRSSMNLSK